MSCDNGIAGVTTEVVSVVINVVMVSVTILRFSVLGFRALEVEL